MSDPKHDWLTEILWRCNKQLMVLIFVVAWGAAWCFCGFVLGQSDVRRHATVALWHGNLVHYGTCRQLPTLAESELFSGIACPVDARSGHGEE